MQKIFPAQKNSFEERQMQAQELETKKRSGVYSALGSCVFAVWRKTSLGNKGRLCPKKAFEF